MDMIAASIAFFINCLLTSKDARSLPTGVEITIALDIAGYHPPRRCDVDICPSSST